MNSTRVHPDDAEAAAERAAITAEGASAEERAVAFSWGRNKSDAYPKQRTAESFAAFANRCRRAFTAFADIVPRFAHP